MKFKEDRRSCVMKPVRAGPEEERKTLVRDPAPAAEV